MAQWSKKKKKISLPVQETQETRVGFLGPEDPLKKEMATHSSILAWRIPWVGELGRLESIRSYRIRRYLSDLACMHTCTFNFPRPLAEKIIFFSLYILVSFVEY